MVDCNYKSPTRSYATICLENRLYPPFHKEQAHFTFPQNSFLAFTRKNIFPPPTRQTYQNPSLPLKKKKHFGEHREVIYTRLKCFRASFCNAAILCGGEVLDKGVEGAAGAGKACKGRWRAGPVCQPVILWACGPVGLWACVSLTPGLAPCHSHVHFAKQKLKRGKKQ